MSTEQGMESLTPPDHFVSGYYAEASPEERKSYGAGVLEARAAAHFAAARTRGAESWAVAILGLDDVAAGDDRISAWEQLHHAPLQESERLVELAPENSFEALSAHLGTLRKAARA